jgi:hypothetical protein
VAARYALATGYLISAPSALVAISIFSFFAIDYFYVPGLEYSTFSGLTTQPTPP